MCVIFFAYQKHPNFPLILLANRDEFYERPTESAKYWEDYPNILAGRDLVGGGTWLGVSKSGKFSAVTNYRDLNAPKGSHSRGDLVADFLKNDESAENYLQQIQSKRLEFSGFNLIVGELNQNRNELFYYSNQQNKITKLESEIYGLSNHFLDTPWRKVEKGKDFLSANIVKNSLSKESFFELLHDKSLADDKDLPDTGIGYEREKFLSAIFIETPIYGTRCSTVVTFNKEFECDFEERVFA